MFQNWMDFLLTGVRFQFHLSYKKSKSSSRGILDTPQKGQEIYFGHVVSLSWGSTFSEHNPVYFFFTVISFFSPNFKSDLKK